MLKTLYLHIGSEKTGSSFLQSLLLRDFDFIMDQGCTLSRSLLERHSLLCIPFASRANTNDIIGVRSYQNVSKLALESLTSFAASCGTYSLLSSEFIHSRIRTSSEVAHLKNFFYQYYDVIHVICYYRDPWKKALSLLSEGLKATSSDLSLNALSNEYFFHSCSLVRTFSLWDSFFDSFEFVSYDDVTNIPNGLARDFFSRTSLPLRKAKDSIRSNLTFNRSLSLHEAKVLSLLNQYLYPFIPLPPRIVDRLGRRLNRIFLNISSSYECYQSSSLSSFFTDVDREYWLNLFDAYEYSR